MQALLLVLCTVVELGAADVDPDAAFWEPEAWPTFGDAARDALVLQELATIDRIARSAAAQAETSQ